MNKELDLLRALAAETAAAAADRKQAQKARLWYDLNHLQPQRPLVFIKVQKATWEEVLPGHSLQCEDPLYRKWEHQLRQKLWRTLVPDDYPITDTLEIPIPIDRGSWGMEEIRHQVQPGGSYRWDPPIQSEADCKTLQPRSLSVDWPLAQRHMEQAMEVFGETLHPVYVGENRCRLQLTKDLIHLRGLEQMLFDVYDNPQLFHRLMEFLTQERLREWQYLEAEGALTSNNHSDFVLGSGALGGTELSADVHCSTSMAEMTCWAESQETSSLSPQHFSEFVLPYMERLTQYFRRVDYGCCEPIHDRLHLITAAMPNLHWTAVSPWCDRKLAAEQIGRHFVYVYKPNPAPLCADSVDWETMEQQIRETLTIAKDCSLAIVMKDLQTVQFDPSRIIEWAQRAQELVDAHGA